MEFKGKEIIGEILTNEYSIKNLKKFEEIEYTIEKFTDKVSKVTIKSLNETFTYVSAIFDGYNMHWSGDYGHWSFNCTWETNLHNLAYYSPYYQLEKLKVPSREEFNEKKCKQELLELIKDGPFYEELDTDEMIERFEQFIEEPLDYISMDEPLYEYEDTCEVIKELYGAAQESEYEWFSAIRNIDLDDFEQIFNCEEYELYNLGKKAPGRFFIILYLLCIVAEREANKEA